MGKDRRKCEGWKKEERKRRGRRKGNARGKEKKNPRYRASSQERWQTGNLYGGRREISAKDLSNRGTCSRRFSVFFTSRFLFASVLSPFLLFLILATVSLFLRSFNLSFSSHRICSHRSGSFLDFSWFFSHFFRHFSKDTSLLSRVSPLRSFHRPSYPLRHSVSKVYPGRLSRNERVAPTGGGFLECARHRSHYRLLIERTTISSINHGADFAPCAWMHRREIQAARI